MIRKFFCLFLINLASSYHALANFITIQTDSSVSIQSNEALVELKISNNGDEPAKRVQAEATLDAVSKTSQLTQTLGTNQSVNISFNLGSIPPDNGIYPVIIRVRYADGNGYPFTAIAQDVLTVGETAPPRVAALFEPLRIKNSGTLILRIKNEESHSIDATANLVLPIDISCAAATQSITLAPNEEYVLKFAVKNFSGRPSSTYTVFGLVQYQKEGKRVLVAAKGFIEFVENRSFLSWHTNLWTAAALVLLAAFFILQLARRR